MDWFDLTALELGAKIQAGEVSAVDAARAVIRAEPVPRRDAAAPREADADARGASSWRAWRGWRDEGRCDARAGTAAECLPRLEGMLKRASAPGSK